MRHFPPPAPQQHETSNVPGWLIERYGPADPDGTWGGMSLEDMVHDCGPVADEDEDGDYLEPSEAYLRRWEGTFSV